MKSLADAITLGLEQIGKSNHIAMGSGNFLQQVMEFYDCFATARTLFTHDQKSLDIFDWFIAHSIFVSFVPGLTDDSIAVPGHPFTKAAWDVLITKAHNMKSGFAKHDYILDRIDTWLLEAYSLKGICEVQAGDVVLDCGTFTGNTSLYFAHKAGRAGHVYGFEAGKDNYAKYVENVKDFPHITPINAAVLGHSGTVCFDATDGAGAKVAEGGAEKVTATTLDSFAHEHQLSRVDFIKMDIEGAEVPALQGATEIIKKYKPKMALSAYHKLNDLFMLPSTLLSICPEYSLYLRHHSIDFCETVLYCVPDPTGGETIALEKLEQGVDHIALHKKCEETLFKLLWRAQYFINQHKL